MSTDPSDSDRDDLERLLDGQDGDPSFPRSERLARLLAAAAAPGRPHEFSRESDVLAAFRAARARPAAAGRARFRSPIAKVAAAVVAVIGMGTTATAMATGLVPNPLVTAHRSVSSDEPARRPRPSRGEGQDRLPSPSTTGAPRTSPSPGPVQPAAPSDRGGLSSGSSPSPTGAPLAITDLCRAYAAISESRREQALEDPIFTPLVFLAGRRSEVGAYCDQFLTSPTLSPSQTPSSSSSPSSSPSAEVSPAPGHSTSTAPSQEGPDATANMGEAQRQVDLLYPPQD